MATIYKDKRTGIWYINYIDPDSHDRVRQPETVQTKDTALKIEKEIRSQVTQSGCTRRPLYPTLEQIAPEVLRIVEINRAENTFKGYKKALKHLIPMYGSLPSIPSPSHSG